MALFLYRVQGESFETDSLYFSIHDPSALLFSVVPFFLFMTSSLVFYHSIC